MLEILDTVVLEEFVSHPVMERLNKPVMPWLTWRDKRLNRLILGRPGLEGVGYELRPVVHPDHPRASSVLQTSHVEQFNHRACVDLLVDCEGNVFACVFVDDVADLDHLAVPGRRVSDCLCKWSI